MTRHQISPTQFRWIKIHAHKTSLLSVHLIYFAKLKKSFPQRHVYRATFAILTHPLRWNVFVLIQFCFPTEDFVWVQANASLDLLREKNRLASRWKIKTTRQFWDLFFSRWYLSISIIITSYNWFRLHFSFVHLYAHIICIKHYDIAELQRYIDFLPHWRGSAGAYLGIMKTNLRILW